MGECAFCDRVGKLSREHIVSGWIDKLFPGKKSGHYRGGIFRRDVRVTRKSIDWTAGVVCEPCNTGWMHNIEDEAKEAMTSLITGQINIPITQSLAGTIASFAFLKAIVVDHASRGRQPFFSKATRVAFRSHRLIPAGVNIWICGFKGHRSGSEVKSVYYDGKSPSSYKFQMYVFTCAFGLFACQLLAVKQIGKARFRSLAGFEDLTVPIWPKLRANFVWPDQYVLDGVSAFNDFADRWASGVIDE